MAMWTNPDHRRRRFVISYVFRNGVILVVFGFGFGVEGAEEGGGGGSEARGGADEGVGAVVDDERRRRRGGVGWGAEDVVEVEVLRRR